MEQLKECLKESKWVCAALGFALTLAIFQYATRSPTPAEVQMRILDEDKANQRVKIRAKQYEIFEYARNEALKEIKLGEHQKLSEAVALTTLPNDRFIVNSFIDQRRKTGGYFHHIMRWTMLIEKVDGKFSKVNFRTQAANPWEGAKG